MSFACQSSVWDITGRLIASLSIIAMLVFPAVQAAEPLDTVWIEPLTAKSGGKPFSPRSIIRRQGTIQSFDEQTLVLIRSGETTAVQVASARVIWAEPGFEDAEIVAAIELFRASESKAAITPLLNAITRGPSVWRAQWLSMQLWQAAYQAERFPAVLELVNQIDARPIPAMTIGGLPVHWTSDRLPPAAVDAARKSLAQSNQLDATRLVAASWLLGHANDQAANAALESLATQSQRPLIAQLATVLLWKKAPPPTVLERHELWSDQVTKLPITLYPGPAVLLADRLEAAGSKELALELFLSIAISSPRPHQTQAVAKTRAAETLQQLGRHEEVMRLGERQ